MHKVSNYSAAEPRRRPTSMPPSIHQKAFFAPIILFARPFVLTYLFYPPPQFHLALSLSQRVSHSGPVSWTHHGQQDPRSHLCPASSHPHPTPRERARARCQIHPLPHLPRAQDQNHCDPSTKSLECARCMMKHKQSHLHFVPVLDSHRNGQRGIVFVCTSDQTIAGMPS